MPRRIVLAFVILGGSLVSLASAAQTQTRTLTLDEIELAIEEGIQRRPEPYGLREELPTEDGGTTWSRAGAWVTTPHQRVRLEAYRAWRGSYQRMTADEIAPRLLGPVAEIAFPGFSHEELFCAGEGRTEVAVFRKGLGQGNPYFSDDVSIMSRPLRPLWLKKARADEIPPHERPAGRESVVVGYPLEFLRSDLEFLVMHKNHDDNCHGSMWGTYRTYQINPGELAAWR